ncbi:MAG: mechanosensitive ion channel family protein [Gemmatimonadota bacterium]|nr:mechanosensitive ion channel family protein [Gemmatimonadota bacterium]
MFLDRSLYGNSLRAWLVAAAAFVVALGVLLLVRRLLAYRLGALALRTTNIVDDLGAEVARRTRLYFLVALAVAIGARFVVLPQRIADTLDKAIALVVLLQAALWGTAAIAFYVARYIERRRETLEASNAWAIRALGVAARVVVWALVFVAVLDNVGFDVTALVTGLGVGGIAIALAVQTILGDVFAAMAIVFDKPFVVGDFIVVDDLAGTVEAIGLKTTRVRSLSGEQLVFGNAELLKSRIRNFKRLYERRNLFAIDVTYDTPTDVVARIPGMLREIVEAQRPVRFDRSHFSGYTESTLRFETVYYVLDPDYNKHMDIQQAIFLAILERFEREGIEFAFPTRTIVHKHEGDQAAGNV